MFLMLFLLYILRSASHAAPLSILVFRETATSAPSSSQPSCTCPDQRSIWNIVWSCFATLFACSWVSVHPNIPAPGEKSWRIKLRRVEYMAWTILAPELVIYWAMRQYFGARAIAKIYQAQGWTTTHAHFLQMGGFMLFEEGIPKGVLFYDKDDTSGTFSALLKQKRIKFPDITKEEIEDRSKSDGLAKCLVIGQTGWFVLQCIARLTAGLVITELELITLALATLNAFMYFFWCHKPFDLRTQVPVNLTKPVPDFEPESGAIPEGPTEGGDVPSRALVSHGSGMLNIAFLHWPKRAIRGIFGGMGGISFRDTAGLVLGMLIVAFFDWPKIAIMGICQRLFEIADSGRHSRMKEGEMGVSMFYSSPTLTVEDGSKIMAVASGIGLAFGAIHCAGWHFIFLTRRELIIWRMGSIIIVAIPCIIFLYSRAWLQYIQTHSSNAASIFHMMQAINVLACPLYVVARLMLLVEALLTLRNLPEGAYTVLEWTSRLRHI